MPPCELARTDKPTERLLEAITMIVVIQGETLGEISADEALVTITVAV